jgi:membrane protein DedA with SNARE-associated domain/rhodanese-related sulfurtransferase
MITSAIPAINYPTILLAVFANQLCLPVPAVLFLITAGALVGRGSLNFSIVVLVGVVGSLAADYGWFMAGRWGGFRVVRTLCAFSANGQHSAVRARTLFARWGLPGVVFAKFVPGLDGLMPPLAGALNVTTVLFLLFDAMGALFWSAGYCFLGYLFSDRLNVVAAMVARTSKILAIVLACVLCYLLWRAWELHRTIRQLQLRTISPALLHEKLQAGDRIAVLDLLDVEGQEDPAIVAGIPGAARISPTPLRSSAQSSTNRCSVGSMLFLTRNQITSARTAVLLRRKGITNVWVLEGGLKAWRELDLPVTTELCTAAQVAARFGLSSRTENRKSSQIADVSRRSLLPSCDTRE